MFKAFTRSKRVTLIACTIVTLIISLILYILLAYAEYEINKTRVRTLSEVMEIQQDDITTTIKTAISDTISLAHFIGNSDFNNSRIIGFLEQQKSILGFHDIHFVYPDGIALTNSWEHIDFSNIIAQENTEYAGVYISSPFIQPSTNNTAIYLYAPIHSYNVLTGYILAEFSLEPMISTINLSMYNNGYSVLYDALGNEHYQTNENHVALKDISDKILEQNVYLEDVLSDFDNMQKGGFVFDDEQNGVTTFVYMPLGINDWMLAFVGGESSIPSVEDIGLLSRVLIVTIVLLFFVMLVILASAIISKTTAEKVAFYDELTGLPNLRKFMIDTQEVLNKNPDKGYHIVKVDIRNFKVINEIFGYEIGDLVLKAFEKTSSIVEEKTFVMARAGSDEFLLFSGNDYLASLDSRTYKSETYLKHLVPEIGDFKLSFCYGRYYIEPGKRDINEILARVTMAHRIAKTRKGNKVVDYSDNFKNQIVRISELTNKMEKALANNEFNPYFQPKFDINKNCIMGAEALARWIEKDGNMIYPDEFITLFESNGFISSLDKYILEYVCKSIKQWMDKGLKIVPVSVNFSRIHLLNADFVDEVCEIVDNSGIPRRYIEIELTESTVMGVEADIEKLFDDLKKAKFAVSIDDFGSGYSSLGMLKDFEIDIIKLDRSFLSKHEDHNRGDIVVEGIINLAHSLSIKLVAEGVENIEQIEMLKEFNCEYAQGYYYSKPIPLSDFEEKYLKD